MGGDLREIGRVRAEIERLEARLRELEGSAISAGSLPADTLSKARLAETYFDIVSVMLIILDRDGRVVQINPRGCEILGCSQEQVLGQIWFETFLPARVREKSRQVFHALMSGKIRPIRYRENPVLTCSGEERVIAWHNSHLRDADGRIVGTISSGADITEQRREEEELARLEEQLRQSQKMESIGSLAGGVAHDFNNLLVPIMGYAEAALRSVEPDDPIARNLTEILAAAERAADLTRHLLAFGRKQVLEMKVTQLNDVVSSLGGMIRRLIGEHVRVRTVLAPDLRPIRADASQIHQILMNLAANARDAMPHGGTLVVETANAVLDEERARGSGGLDPGPYVEMTVKDTGAGMDEETSARIFEPFFTTKGEGEGTGMGLATVYGIVKQHRGHIELESEPGQGSLFRMLFPAVAGDSVEPAGAVEGEAARESGVGGTVLVVEDERAVRELVCRMLENAGYRVLEAAGPAAAIAASERHEGQIRLLLTDVIMPGMNGSELYRRLRSTRGDLGVLYMSGYTGDVIAHHGVLDAGVCFIQKPFNAAALRAKIEEALGS